MKAALTLLAIIVGVVFANSEEGKMMLQDLQRQAAEIDFDLPESNRNQYAPGYESQTQIQPNVNQPLIQNYRPVDNDEYESVAQGRPDMNQYRFGNNLNTARSIVRPRTRDKFVRRNGF